MQHPNHQLCRTNPPRILLEDGKVEAQETLDELWAEHLIPFKLTAYKIDSDGKPGYYTVHFFDARLHSLFIYWNPEKESFKTAVREVVENTVGSRSRAKDGWPDSLLALGITGQTIEH